MLEFGSDNYFKWGRQSVSSNSSHKVLISASGIQCDFRDISYYVNKKQGFPSIKDTGLMDVFLGGEGFGFSIKLATADSSDKQRFFKVEKIDVTIKHLSIKLKQSKFKVVFALAKPLLLKIMRPVIQKVLEKQIKDSVDKLDAMAYAVHEEATKAASEVKENPEEAQNVYNRYYQAGQQQLLKGKQKKDKVQKDVSVNVAVTQHDSIFKDIKLPGGISTKATEYKDLAAKGEKWESPVFSIGSASESANITKPTNPVRKVHDVTEARLTHPSESQHLNGTNGNTNGHSNGLQAGSNGTYSNGNGYTNGNGSKSSVTNGALGTNGHSIGQPPAGYTGNVNQ
jgi:hypothetical protein